MRNLTRISGIAIVTFFLGIFCLQAQVKVKDAKISGKLTDNQSVTEIFLKIPNREASIVATSKIGPDGSFQFQVPITDQELYKIWINDNSNLLISLEPGDNLEINASAANLSNNPELNGVQENIRMMIASQAINNFTKQLDSIEKFFRANQSNVKLDSLAPILRSEYEKRDEIRKSIIRNYIGENPSSLTGLVFIERLDIETEFDTYDKYDRASFKAHPNNAFVKDFHNKVEAERKVSIGQIAPEISLKNPQGIEVKLSSLRGKVVLVDFWASWCGPCRKENPHVVECYKKYHDKGFEVFGVSLDRDGEAWKKAIENDGLSWTQVSDLLYWKSEAAKLYGVSAIPCTFLLDRDGKIIGKKLRGESLDSKLLEIFGF